MYLIIGNSVLGNPFLLTYDHSSKYEVYFKGHYYIIILRCIHLFKGRYGDILHSEVTS